MKLDIYNKIGEKLTKKVTVSDTVFGLEPSEHSVYLSVKSELASLRQGSHKAKNKAEVSGTGKKPWKQKGTGRARVGEARNPSRVHGGVAFPPTPHKYSIKVNKKVKRLARKSVLSAKIASGNLFVIEDLILDTPKTNAFLEIIKNMKLSQTKVTVLASVISEELWLSARNIKNITVIPAESASTYDLIDCKNILIDVAGIESLNTQLAN
jgi:large subunit ribosomal protein L4